MENSKLKKLVCYGCAHSGAEKYFPSGERPCCFCIRNSQLPKNPKDFKVNCWYDGSKAIKLPMDCYHSLDMLEQINFWEKSGYAKKEKISRIYGKETSIHIDYAPTKDCQMARYTYGEVCIKCNICGRFKGMRQSTKEEIEEELG